MIRLISVGSSGTRCPASPHSPVWGMPSVACVPDMGSDGDTYRGLVSSIEHCAFTTGATGSNPVPNHRGENPLGDPVKVTHHSRWRAGTRRTRRRHVNRGRSTHGTPSGSPWATGRHRHAGTRPAKMLCSARIPLSRHAAREVAKGVRGLRNQSHGRGPTKRPPAAASSGRLKQRSASRGRFGRFRSSGGNLSPAIP